MGDVQEGTALFGLCRAPGLRSATPFRARSVSCERAAQPPIRQASKTRTRIFPSRALGVCCFGGGPEVAPGRPRVA